MTAKRPEHQQLSSSILAGRCPAKTQARAPRSQRAKAKSQSKEPKSQRAKDMVSHQVSHARRHLVGRVSRGCKEKAAGPSELAAHRRRHDTMGRQSLLSLRRAQETK